MNFDREAFRQYYETMTSDENGKNGFYPYEYQTRVAELFAEGKNVILSVPTGAGKTWASIMPFLFAKKNNDFSFPRKMIYSLPLRTLTNSIYIDVHDALKKHGYSDEEIQRQTGEFSDDKYFEKELIFSTIDQTLSNFCSFPLALSQRQANINAGALIGSYLVFDEFHLLDASLSMATTLGMINMLKKLSRFCIMTATLSDEFLKFLKNDFPELNFEVVTLNDFPEDAKIIKSLLPPIDKKNKKQVHIQPHSLNAKLIIEKHKNRTIVICNRVETAQKIYLDIQEELEKTGRKINAICIHSRFFDAHRKMKEKDLKEKLGKANKDKNVNVILVATQVIEAGMDISCEVMHTEISPANSFLQRIGRCARFANEYGDIYVYKPMELEEKEKVGEGLAKNDTDKKEIQKLNRLYMPYERTICETTFNALMEDEFKFINEQTSERLVNRVMKDIEVKETEIMRTAQFNEGKIIDAWKECSKSHYGKLIRDIQSIELVLIDESKEKEVVWHPFRFESMSMYRWSFVKWVNDIYKNYDSEEDEWVIKKLSENQIFDEGDESKYQLDFLDNETVKSHYDLTFINAKYFHYDKSIGLNLNFGKELSPLRPFKEKETFDTLYKKDTFLQHNYALLGAFKKQFLEKKQLDYALAELGRFLNRPALKTDDWIRLIRLMIIFHDYGKLNNRWQKWMQTLQKAKANQSNSNCTYVPNEPLGHTDFDKEKDEYLEKEIYKKFGKRPPHSGIGALAIRGILEDWMEGDIITNATSLAIARHHGVENMACPKFEISEVNFKVMYELAKVVDFGISDITREEDGEDLDFEHRPNEYILYFFLVRILRMCDQMATADFEKWIVKNRELTT